MFNATQIIADTFEERGIKFCIEEDENISCVNAVYGIPGGPYANIRFISADDDPDVAVRVFSLFNSIPEEKELAMYRAFSDIHRRVRYTTFYFDTDMDINMAYDVPTEVSYDDLGAVCFELFRRVTYMLRNEYHTLAQALYEGGYKPKDIFEEMAKLEMLRMMKETAENPFVIDNDDEEDSLSCSHGFGA